MNKSTNINYYMKSIIDDVSHFLIFIPGIMLLIFRVKLSSFYKKYGTEDNKNVFASFYDLFKTGYSPFFKLEAKNDNEIPRYSEIFMNWKKAIDILFVIAFSLFL